MTLWFNLFSETPENRNEPDYDNENGDCQNCADFDEIEKSVATWRVDKNTGGFERRDERTWSGVSNRDSESARI